MARFKNYRDSLVAIAIASMVVLPTAAEDEDCVEDVSVSMERAVFGITFSASRDGFLIGAVHEGEAAQKAGLRRGDTIVSINGFLLKFDKNVEALRWADGLRAGRPVRMEVIREGKKFAVTLVGRAPTCDEARKISERLAGGRPTGGTEPCSSFWGNECKAQKPRKSAGEVLSDEFVRLLKLAEERGDLTLQIAGPSGGFGVEIVKPAGLSTSISIGQLTSEFTTTAEKLRGSDTARFLIKIFPAVGGELGRFSIQLLDAPDYAHNE